MSYDRVLPAPVGMHHESAGSNPLHSNPFEHKIMNDLPMSHGALPYRPDPLGSACRYTDYRPKPQMQQMAIYHGKVEPYNPPIEINHNIPPATEFYPKQPSVSTNSIAFRERTPSSSGSSSPTKSGKEEYAGHWCLCKPDPKIPRPRNAFILYRQHHQAAVVAHHPGLANPDISKIIGMQWRALTEAEKNKWRALAEEEKARHAQQYPTYRYQPKRAGRDGNARNSGSGISHNPSGGSTCNTCGGKIMNAPCSPIVSYTPKGTEKRSASMSTAPPGRTTTTIMTARSSHGAEKQPQPIRIDQMDNRARPRKFEEIDDQSQDMKRRRISQVSIKSDLPTNRHRSPESMSPYPMSPYLTSARPDGAPQRQQLPSITSPFSSAPVPAPSGPDPSLKLAPLQNSTSSMTPLTPFSQDGSCSSSVEATVMTIPYLNKIKVLAKISPALQPSFRQMDTNANPMRGPVVAIDGQDPDLVQSAMEFLTRLFKKEAKYSVRVFHGPNIKAPLAEVTTADPTVEYLDTISAWHRVSDEVKDFVRTVPSSDTPDRKYSLDDGSASPKTVIPKTTTFQLHSPDSSESGSIIGAHTALPLAIVPRYQLTTADAFACSIPINDSYNSLDHWQWMASLWRACVGPDITVYIRECSCEELERVGGNSVEMRLQDARTIVLRKVIGSPGLLEEKALKRVGFEIEDYLTQ
ncbi:hypothetical protein N7532_003109 [Penicillium argentinense]|uniref:HMG box domain-containing protein n=1 Tax=Penicillium argentinense TaxID=1131581 RepID=A0A9W9FLV1_9EURO|nr:uncharacterized protein N7532_003109 [Penicillium argentinense]KAJ5102580.1 hypothetical protein N7532_003109 [Penicillium argentinense]